MNFFIQDAYNHPGLLLHFEEQSKKGAEILHQSWGFLPMLH
ncbi:hypothetical protein pah_c268o008 [Parachlamydia acanthamoebae str. Hall's coccus]|nr:hypothetical protein pah_c268o008 [Parachlamydia acanthamoebae str. Hall's coccus]